MTASRVSKQTSTRGMTLIEIMVVVAILGMIASVVDMDYLIRRLQQVSQGGLMP